MRKQPLAGFFMSQSTDCEQSPAALSALFLDRAGHVHEQGGGAAAFKLDAALGYASAIHLNGISKID